MQENFEFITALALKYKAYNETTALLYNDLNKLSLETLQRIYAEYGDPERSFKPVNLLRAEIARLLIEGMVVTEQDIANIKTSISAASLEDFTHLPDKILKELSEYRRGKRNMFANWQNPWNVLHVFFYRDELKVRVVQTLNEIGMHLLSVLDLSEYDLHCVDFYGASNFGSDRCWIALYPMQKNSHQFAYQFFINLTSHPEAGQVAGSKIRNPNGNSIKSVSDYDELVHTLKSYKDEIVKLNGEIKNYFKFSPGAQAADWLVFRKEGVIAISFLNLKVGDLNQYRSLEELNLAAGLPEDSRSNQTWNLWLFKCASTGDVVFANKGANECLGVGYIDGSYYYDEKDPVYPHKRKMDWRTDLSYQYKPKSILGIHNLFRQDTFSPTNNGPFILQEYMKRYPQLADDALFSIKSVDETARKHTAADLRLTEKEKEEEMAAEESSEPVSYWWLNSNSAIWNINTVSLGDTQEYTTYNEQGNKRRIYKHFEAVKPGDLIVGYETSPAKKVRAIYTVTKGKYIQDNKECIQFEITDLLEEPVSWSELKSIPALQECEVFKNNQGSLFKLTENEFDIIREVIDGKILVRKTQLIDSKLQLYSFTQDVDKPFIKEDQFRDALQMLKTKKNVILQGPPGVGKTFIAKKLAYEIMGATDDAQIEMVQFHQSYSYEDFIQGVRPGHDGKFAIADGVFYAFCQRAMVNPGKSFFFIIDEINRGNLSKIFGELMLLIEADKRSAKYALKLTYADGENDLFFVPANVYIIGTMNTADRSLAIIDYALRRRFAFVNLSPEFDNAFIQYLSSKGITNKLVSHICSVVTNINTQVKADTSLGEGFQIGHSYFCGYDSASHENEIAWWSRVVLYELRPLLEEIWFDNKEQVETFVGELSFKG